MGLRLPKSGRAGLRLAAVGVAGVLAAVAFVWGLALEVAPVFERTWLAVVAVAIPWALLLVLSAATLGRNSRATRSVLLGAVLGVCSGGMFILGIFSAFLLEIGDRELDQFGAETGWAQLLQVYLLLAAVIGAAVGAVCGVVSWTLALRLGCARED